MAILKAAPKPPKNETLQLRVEEEIKSKLAKYAEFIDSSESYVVSAAQPGHVVWGVLDRIGRQLDVDGRQKENGSRVESLKPLYLN
jgi:hypothetical protein